MSHYFETPTGDDARFDVGMRLWDHDVTLTSAKGVFARTGLDIGTAVPLRSLDPPADGGELLDLGCGIGTIALALALECPTARITAVDVNDRALDLTRVNARRLGVDGQMTIVRSDAADPDARYDEIWSNPPIRIGKQALHDLLTTWLGRLKPTGVAHLVVARNLGADSLAAWLTAEGFACTRVASAKGFRVFDVRLGQTP